MNEMWRLSIKFGLWIFGWSIVGGLIGDQIGYVMFDR